MSSDREVQQLELTKTITVQLLFPAVHLQFTLLLSYLSASELFAPSVKLPSVISYCKKLCNDEKLNVYKRLL